MEHGLPARSATSDANAGIIDPPVTKHSTRQIGTSGNKQDSPVGEALRGVTKTLGDAITKFRAEETTDINHRRALQAAAEQGEKIGLSEDVKAKKNTGWSKFLYGDNPEYRAAQQRSVSNSVMQTGTTLASEIDQWAGTSPEDFAKEMVNRGEEMIDKYDDQETRDLVAAGWAEQTAKLTASHKKARSAWTSAENRRTAEEEVKTILDEAMQSAKDSIDPEQTAKYFAKAKSAFEGSLRPRDMHPVAWRSMMMGVVSNGMAEGNVGVYKLAKDAGFFDNMTNAESLMLDKARKAFSAEVNLDSGRVAADTRLALADARSDEEVDETIDQAIASQEELLSSPALEEGAETAIKNRIAALKELRNKAKADAAKRNLKELQAKEDDNAYFTGEAFRQGASPTDMKEAGERVVRREIQYDMGNPDATDEQMHDHLLKNPQVLKTLNHMFDKNDNIKVDFYGQMGRTFMKRITESMEDGVPTEETRIMMQNAKDIFKNRGVMASVGTGNLETNLAIIAGLEQGLPIDRARDQEARISAYKAAGGSMSTTYYRDSLKRINDTKDLVWTSEHRRGEAAYKRGLALHEGDERQAWDYAQSALNSNSSTFHDRYIVGGQRLQTEYGLFRRSDSSMDTIENGMDKIIDSVAKMHPQYKDIDRGTLNIQIDDRSESVRISGPTVNTVVLPIDAMQQAWAVEDANSKEGADARYKRLVREVNELIVDVPAGKI